jgi:DNA-binding GntR family transcriptional regulator
MKTLGAVPDASPRREIRLADAETFRSAQEQAYSWIRQQIRSGKLASGTRVIAEDIAAEMSISRMPVREAIRQLDSEGLLTIRPNRGAIVTELTPDDVLELFEMRARLEGLAMRKAVKRLDDDLEDSLVLQLRRLGRASNSVDAFMRQHEEFHRLICVAGSRAWLFGETQRLRAACEPHLRLYFTHHAAGANRAVEEHDRVLQALLSRDEAHADDAMQQHILSTAPELIEFLRQTPL